MEKNTHQDENIILSQKDSKSAKEQRRSFLKYAGAGFAVLASVSTGCNKEKEFDKQDPYDFGFDFKSGDIAILNYAYALEQLEAAFYTRVTKSPTFTTLFNATEQSFLIDIRDHEIAHREYLKVVLLKQGIGALDLDFSSIDFTNRTSILTNAKAFEDLGVSAYNGVAFLIKSPVYLLVAGKISSVEGRHAAVISNLLKPGSFADPLATGGTLDSDGLEVAKSPTQVLSIASKYIKSAIITNNLPNF
ncbi:ferritin-like domain-containing protein [Mucilaginibacter terrae]|uniref:ferritin-like domain-containing protein n=1 Tax=Mucilaginibacter terrae TaxID=1955052 RepID=UPI00362FE1E7